MKFAKIIGILITLTIAASVFSKAASRHKRSRSAFKAPAKVASSSTGFTATDGGKIFYLDRQTVSCPNGALSFFQMNRKGDNIRYNTSCINADSITGTTSVNYTQWNATSGSVCVNFLDRHNMACPNGQVLSSFKLQRNNSQIRYQYSCIAAQTVCCKTVSGPKQDMGDRTIFYLDRQQVGTFNSKDTVLSQIKLSTSYSPDLMWYNYTQCKIADVDAINAVKNLNAAVAASTQAVSAAQNAVNSANAQAQALQQQLQSLQNSISTNAAAVKAAQDKLAAASQKLSNDQVALATANGNPALKC